MKDELLNLEKEQRTLNKFVDDFNKSMIDQN